jgi:hypothetical protein
MAQDVIPINFAVNSYQTRSKLASSERLINMYCEKNSELSPFKFSLYNTPGYDTWTTVTNSNPIYGMHVFQDQFLFVVFGVDVYVFDATKTATLVGSMSVTPGPVQMTDNGQQVTILTSSGVAYYVTYISSVFTLAQITDSNYLLSSSVTTLDGYTIFSVIDSNQWFISNVNDTSTYQALNTAYAQAYPDNLVAVFNYNRTLVLMGTTTTEYWLDQGNLTFPFARIDSAVMLKGCAAKLSVVVDVTGYYWLGNDGIVYTSNSYYPGRISTFAVENAISNYSTISDASAFIYVENGHRFYVLSFPTAQATWVYDITMQLWHERQSLNSITYRPQNWSAVYHATFNNQDIVNGPINGSIYQLNLNSYSEDAIPLISEITSCTNFKDFKRFTVHKLAIMMDFGVGISTGQGLNPIIMIQISLDGGYTWSKEIQGYIGEQGAYGTEVYWTNIAGATRSIIFKLKISDPVKRTILGAYMNVTEDLS